jgi:hypothetical protein
LIAPLIASTARIRGSPGRTTAVNASMPGMTAFMPEPGTAEAGLKVRTPRRLAVLTGATWFGDLMHPGNRARVPLFLAGLAALALSACHPTTAGSICRLRPNASCKGCVDCVGSTCEPSDCADAGPGVSTCSLGLCRVPCTRNADCAGFSDCDTCGTDGFCQENFSNACHDALVKGTAACHPVRDRCGGVVTCAPCPAGEVCGVEGACVAGSP